MKIFTVLLGLIFCTACNQRHTNDANTNQMSTIDSSDTVVKVGTTDSSEEALGNNGDLDQAIYKNKTKIDTGFFRKDIKFQLNLETYFDSLRKIIVPKKYVGVYGLDSFEVFEMYTRVRLLKNSSVILDTIIRKKDFSQ
jgi:hypothetical protein